MSATLPLSPQVFAILSALIEARTGLHYDSHERELLADRASGRALERGFDSLLDYYYFLRYDPATDLEMAALAEALVVNETYFFRELPALELLVTQFVPELLLGCARPRLWCAAASTGEEPLTLAMLLDRAGLLGRVGILASDLSARALAQAKAGLYRRRSLRALPSGVVGRWLHGDEESMQVAPHIAQAVEWTQLNLMDEVRVAELGQFDVILCRNVLIYFRDRTIEQVVERLWERLTPNGCLFVGTSESLLRFDVPFTCEEQRGCFFYRKQPK